MRVGKWRMDARAVADLRVLRPVLMHRPRGPLPCFQLKNGWIML